MGFILLSIATFVLRTLSIFQTIDYELVPVICGANQTELTLVLTAQNYYRYNAAFDLMEWICKGSKRFRTIEERLLSSR